MGRPSAARLRAAGLDLLQRLTAAREFLLDHLDGRRPDERFRMLIPRGQKLHNGLSVSNSLSSRDWQRDEVPAVGDPAHLVQFGNGDRMFINKGQRRVALQ